MLRVSQIHCGEQLDSWSHKCQDTAPFKALIPELCRSAFFFFFLNYFASLHKLASLTRLIFRPWVLIIHFATLALGCVYVCSVAQLCPTFLQVHGLQPTRLLCPWSFSGKNTETNGHFLFQGIFLTQGSNLHLLHWQADSLPRCHLGSQWS